MRSIYRISVELHGESLLSIIPESLQYKGEFYIYFIACTGFITTEQEDAKCENARVS
jgi:hypothetical protein